MKIDHFAPKFFFHHEEQLIGCHEKFENYPYTFHRKYFLYSSSNVRFFLIIGQKCANFISSFQNQKLMFEFCRLIFLIRKHVKVHKQKKNRLIPPAGRQIQLSEDRKKINAVT